MAVLEGVRMDAQKFLIIRRKFLDKLSNETNLNLYLGLNTDTRVKQRAEVRCPLFAFQVGCRYGCRGGPATVLYSGFGCSLQQHVRGCGKHPGTA